MKIQFTQLPALPAGLKNGVGFVNGIASAEKQVETIYTGLGSLGQQWWSLTLNDPLGWQAKAPFPGVARNDAVCIPVEGGCYVFSGAGVADGGNYTTVLVDGYYYDCQQDRWQKVADSTPVGLLGGAGIALDADNLVFVGGYNKAIFDGLMAQLNEPLIANDAEAKQACLVQFMSQSIDDYQWNDKVYGYQISTQQWHVIASNPFQANCGAGVLRSCNRLTLVEGEVKPGLRSLRSKQLQFMDGKLVESTYLPSIHDHNPNHEGLAGAYCAEVNGQWLVAGGAYFIGSQLNYQQGQCYSHQGLSKTFASKIWSFDGNQWQHVGDLPQGCAYGITVTTQQGMLIIGGESQQGEALADCYLVECAFIDNDREESELKESTFAV